MISLLTKIWNQWVNPFITSMILQLVVALVLFGDQDVVSHSFLEVVIYLVLVIYTIFLVQDIYRAYKQDILRKLFVYALVNLCIQIFIELYLDKTVYGAIDNILFTLLQYTLFPYIVFITKKYS